MAKKHECPPPDNTERWAVSYLDMITVMMCLFLVLYAISQVDQGKLAKLRQSLAAGFNNEAVAQAPIITAGGVGVLTGSTSSAEIGHVMGGQNGQTAEGVAAMKEAAKLEEIKKKIDQKLEESGHAKALDYHITPRGLVLGMVANDTYFAPDQAIITPTAREVLGVVAQALAPLQEDIAIDGYTDTMPNATPLYPDNLSLAAGRAVEVTRYLQAAGVPGNRLSATSFGEWHQVAAKPGEDQLAINRRVDIVVVSNAPESVRHLLPEADKKLTQGIGKP